MILSKKILIILCFLVCGSQSTNLNFIESFELKSTILEPSGLCVDPSGDFLWTVSDTTGCIYKITKNGVVLDTIDIQGRDLEAITTDGNYLYVAQEGALQILKLEFDGTLVETYKIKGIDSPGRFGIEGLCFDVDRERFVIAKERLPLIIVECDTEFNEILRDTIVDTFVNNVAGLMYDPKEKCVWLINDWKDCIVKWDSKSGLGERKFLGNDTLDLENPEGIAIDAKNDRLYVVIDAAVIKPRIYSYGFNSVPIVNQNICVERKYEIQIVNNLRSIIIKTNGLDKKEIVAQLYNVKGVLIGKLIKDVSSNGDPIFSIKFSQNSTGVYILNINVGNENIKERIFIQK